MPRTPRGRSQPHVETRLAIQTDDTGTRVQVADRPRASSCRCPAQVALTVQVSGCRCADRLMAGRTVRQFRQAESAAPSSRRRPGDAVDVVGADRERNLRELRPGATSRPESTRRCRRSAVPALRFTSLPPVVARRGSACAAMEQRHGMTATRRCRSATFVEQRHVGRWQLVDAEARQRESGDVHFFDRVLACVLQGIDRGVRCQPSPAARNPRAVTEAPRLRPPTRCSRSPAQTLTPERRGPARRSHESVDGGLPIARCADDAIPTRGRGPGDRVSVEAPPRRGRRSSWRCERRRTRRPSCRDG